MRCTFMFLLVGMIVEDTVAARPNVIYERQQRSLPPQGQVTVYINENHKGVGESYILPQYVCVDIDPSYLGYISSIKPAPGTCVQVFKAKGCPKTEEATELKDYSLGTDMLYKIGLNDQISSIKYCDYS